MIARKKWRHQKTDLDKLNELIDWYNKFKPQAGKVIKVRFEEGHLNRFAKPVPGKPNFWAYRDRLLERLPS